MKPWIDVDPATFEPMRIQAVTHHLSDHPLLQLGSLVDLAKRLVPIGAARFHSGNVGAETSFVDAPKQHPVGRPPAEILADIENSNAWFSLHNIQVDEVYRRFVGEVLDSVRPIVEARDPGMHFRASWIFVSSPGAVTPYHLDHEHNFILQIRGTKVVHVFDPLDPEVVTQEALERFHGAGSRELVTYRPELEARGHAFHVRPGVGAYMPSNAPHWVKNDDNVSITVSFTWFSRETRRRRALFQLNHALRARGLGPRPVGANPLLDEAAARGYETWLRTRHQIDRLRGRPFHDLDVPFATNPPGSEYGTA